MPKSQTQCIQVYAGANGSVTKVARRQSKRLPHKVYCVIQDLSALPKPQSVRIVQSVFVTALGVPVLDGASFPFDATTGETEVLTVDTTNPRNTGQWDAVTTQRNKPHIFFPAGGIIIEN